MSKKKNLGFIAFIAVAGLAFYLVTAGSDLLVKKAIETYGSAATQTKVSVDSLDLDMANGTGVLEGLSIANPKGFSDGAAFYLGGIDIKIDPASVMGSGPIVVTEVNVRSPQILYEVTATGDSNLSALSRNASKSGGDANKDNAKKDDERKVVIKNLYIRDGKVTLSSPKLSDKRPVVPLPMVQLANLGTKSGATPAELAQRVIAVVSARVSATAAQSLFRQIAALKAPTGGAAEKLDGALKGLFGQ